LSRQQKEKKIRTNKIILKIMATKKSNSLPPEIFALYEKLVATNPKIELKGATIPYTSHNGHMFSNFNPDGTLGLRLPPDEIEAFLKKYKTTLVSAYGVVRKEYVVVPDTLLKKTRELKPYFDLSFKYVSSMKPKTKAK
jgi:hypothetical protein